MCMEDIQLGRESYTVVKTIQINTVTDTQICKAASKRIALRVSIREDAGAVRPENGDTTAGEGFYIAPTKPDFEINIVQHGLAVTESWVGRSETGTARIAVMETFLGRNS
jgi:hypothetical protein